jgi:REP element-mobilizing transposase RayT
MNSLRIGLHFVLTPHTSSTELPLQLAGDFTEILQRVGKRWSCYLREVSVLPDHLHVLIATEEDDLVERYLHDMLDALRNCVRNACEELANFEWSDAVHVTMLPPWHIDILSSFIRDQSHYHKTHTLQQELNEVFLPNGSVAQGINPTFNDQLPN